MYVTTENNFFFHSRATSFEPCNLMKNFLLLQIVTWLWNCLDFPFWFSHKHIPYIFLSIHKLPSQMKLFTTTFEVFLFMGLVMYPWLTELFILSNKSSIFTAMVIFLVSDPQWLIFKFVCNHKRSFENYIYCFLYKICKSVWLTLLLIMSVIFLMFSFVLFLLTGEAIGDHYSSRKGIGM